MKKRVITATIMCSILLPILFFGSYFMIALVMFLSFMGVFELSRMYCQKNNIKKRFQYLFSIVTSILVGLIATYFYLSSEKIFEHQISYLGLMITVGVLMFVCLLIIPIFDKTIKMKDIFCFMAFMLYGGFLFVFLARLRFINNIDNITWGFNIGSYYVDLIGLSIVGYALITSSMTDVFAQLGGMAFGKHRLCPNISPKKTIEGSVIGSVLGAVLGTTVILLCQHFGGFVLLPIENGILNGVIIFVITLVLTILGQLGDLIASLIKREHDIKDYGNLLPGHGGVMDRFDSAIMVCTILFIILDLIFIISGKTLW